MRMLRMAGLLLTLCVGSLAIPAFARSPYILNSLPGSLREVFDVLDPAKPASIPSYLAGAKCGGWSADPNLTVGAVPGLGRIALVQGFPGRPYLPLWNVYSGIAQPVDAIVLSGGTVFLPFQNIHSGITRPPDPPTQTGSVMIDTFTFPMNTEGMTTVCRPYQGSVTIPVWVDGTGSAWKGGRLDTDIPYPYFEDPPCIWEADPMHPMQLRKTDPPHSEEKCRDFCHALNSFIYRDCPDSALENIQVQEDVPDPVTGQLKKVMTTIKRCKRDGWQQHHVCSGQMVTSDFPNCRPGPPAFRGCMGGECRCPGSGCLKTPDGLEYHSFFRKYQGNYLRATVPDVPTDIGRGDVTAACYGFYQEFNTARRQTQDRDWRCAVNVKTAKQLLTSQQGKGAYGSNPPRTDVPAAQRGPVPPDPSRLWALFTGAFSLLQERVFQETYDRHITNAALDTEALDTAVQRAAVQHTADEPVAVANQALEFDETGNGTIVRWWHKQQRMARLLFSRPVVHLLLPPRMPLGLDASAPPFAPALPPDDDNSAPQSRPIRLQLDAGEDLVGAVLRASALPMEEIPITIPVFASSVTEIRVLRETWCLRFRQVTKKSTCEGGGIDPILQRFDQYITYMERVRELRSALVRYVGEALSIQYDIHKPILQSLRSVLQRYRDMLQEQKNIEDTLLPVWREAEASYRTLHEQTNLPYCMKQQFAPRIPSLLDPWLPARTENGSVFEIGSESGRSLPTLQGLFSRSEALIVNLTNVRGLSSTIRLPVLQPTIIRISLSSLTPPGPDSPMDTFIEAASRTATTLSSPPDLAVINTSLRQAWESLPRVDASHALPPSITFPPPLGTPLREQIHSTLGRIRDTVRQIEQRYAYFWHSILGFTDDARFPRPSCQTTAGRTIPLGELQCCHWGQIPCLAEMDLVPIIARVASRPMVGLKEDRTVHGLAREFPPVCLDRSPACSLPPEETVLQPTLWDVHMPLIDTVSPAINQLRSTVNSQTLPAPLGNRQLPPLEIHPAELLPALNVPPPTSILP